MLFSQKKDMNRKLLVTLLSKNIEELNVITDGFMEMDHYPASIVYLAKRKTEDIQIIIDQLAAFNDELKQMVDNEYFVEKEIMFNDSYHEDNETEILNEIPVSETNSEEEITTISQEETIQTIVTTYGETEESITETTEEVTVSVTESEAELVIETNETKQLTELSSNAEIKITTEETKKTTIADKIIQPTVSRNETLFKTDNSLSASIANKKITDIKQAISIGDRFRFQRELFKGNGEEMNKTLNYINQLATLDEVSSFLQSKYGWTPENETAEDFYQIIKRKFL